jgi:hypothetical protein
VVSYLYLRHISIKKKSKTGKSFFRGDALVAPPISARTREK